MATGEDAQRWEILGQEDVVGLDRLGRSLLRMIGRMEPASLVAVHGAPGSGKAEFLRRLAWLASGKSKSTEPLPGIFPGVVWFDPWAWSKQGNILSGLIHAVIKSSANSAQLMERGRDLVSRVSRLRFDGKQPEGAGMAFGGTDSDPVEQLAEGFAALVQAAKGGRSGRLLVFVDELDSLAPPLRWQLFDGLRLLMRARPDLTAVLSVGRESALSAIRFREGDIPEASAVRELEEIIDLAITVPSLEVRRIGTLLREYLGTSEVVVRKSFGNESITMLSAGVAHRPLGAPRFLKRLSCRVVLLAEFALEVRAVRELSEAQWAWVIVSERWPEFRRFMIRGGRERWLDLKHAMIRLSARNDGKAPPPAGGATILKWLEGDLILADYLRLHAEGFEKDAEGIFWLENLMLTAGL